MTFALATSVYAETTPVEPDHGTMSPGDSITAQFVLEPPDLLGIQLASCVLASVSPNPGQFIVTFGGLLPADCTALASADVEVTVEARPTAEPGDYTLTLTEVLDLGGDLVSTQNWSFTVEETSTTTTTTSTTTTSSTTTSTMSPVDTTSSTSSTTTTVSPDTTTTTLASTTTVRETEAPETTKPESPTTSVAADTTSTASKASPSAKGDDDPVVASGVGTGPGAPMPEAVGPEGDERASISISQQLTSQLSDATTPGVAQAVMSPLVLSEFLFRSVLSSAAGYALPLLIAFLLSAGLVWRMRREVTDDEFSLE